MIEVMIAAAILAGVLAGVLGYLGSVDQAQTANSDAAEVQEILHTMGERFLGTSWNDIGRRLSGSNASFDPNAWSWPRRATARSSGDSWYADIPLVEGSSDSNRDLVRQGILKRTTGLPGLRVYVEYYRQDAVMQCATHADPPARWRQIAGHPLSGGSPTEKTFLYPPSPAVITGQADVPDSPDKVDLRAINDAICIRILVTWRPEAGGARWQELTLLRKK